MLVSSVVQGRASLCRARLGTAVCQSCCPAPSAHSTGLGMPRPAAEAGTLLLHSWTAASALCMYIFLCLLLLNGHRLLLSHPQCPCTAGHLFYSNSYFFFFPSYLQGIQADVCTWKTDFLGGSRSCLYSFMDIIKTWRGQPGFMLRNLKTLCILNTFLHWHWQPHWL